MPSIFPTRRRLINLIFGLALLPCLATQADSQDDGRVVSIPVVFHVLYFDNLPDNGINRESRDEGNSTSHLTREKIEAELRDLDADLQTGNSDLTSVIEDFRGVIGYPKVHFYLSDLKYVQVKARDIRRPSNNTRLLHRLSPIVDSKLTLNVYISQIKYKGNFTNGLSPVKTSLNAHDGYDVVNLNYRWVGLGYRLLTHEVGHWLGLWHTWDDRQKADGIDDIPLQKRSTDVDCVKCPPAVRDRVRSNSGFARSNFNNFMDYSGCRSMFSKDQASHIRKVLREYRPQMWDRPPATSGH